MTSDEVALLVARFEDGTLPKAASPAGLRSRAN
jgi:hypothetical protein